MKKIFAQEWPEARIIAAPEKNRAQPEVLVRRNTASLTGPNGEELIYLPGNPAISLFTGAGGMDIGLENAGFCCVCQHEWSQAPCETLIANRPDFFRHAALIQGDIRATPTEMILAEAGLDVGEAHLVCGGPPCQGFSTSNRYRGKIHDPRNDLVFEFLRVCREAMPRFFFFENVPGIMTMNGGDYFEAFLRQAFSCFYELVYGLIDCCEYGVPQRRIRFVCIGTRRDQARRAIAGLPDPEHFGKRDLAVIRREKFMPWTEKKHQILRAPGIRYFPDRPILRPPSPHLNGDQDGRAKSFLEFYSHVERTEPDRLVRPPAQPLNFRE